MSSRLAVLLGVAVLAAGCSKAGQKEAAQPSTQQAPADSTAADRAALDKLRADYVNAYNAHDAAAVAALFTDSCFALWADGSFSGGRAAVQARTEREVAANPTVAIDTKDMLILGDNAVAHGSYTVTMPPAKAGGSTVSFGGAYIGQYERVNGAWKINTVLTNFAATPPASVKMAPDTSPPPPDKGTMGELQAGFVKAFNAGDWAGVASFYTPDAYVSPGAPEADVTGRDALQALYAKDFGNAKLKAEMHDVGTMNLSPDYALDGGWYRVTGTMPQGKVDAMGIYLDLLQKQADGSWKFLWDVSHSQPKRAS